MSSKSPPRIDRQSGRIPLQAKVSFVVESFLGFIEEYSANISRGGMFIRTADPKPVGTWLDLEFRLADDFPLIRGRAVVVWLRQADPGDDEPGGMGVRFDELDQKSGELVERIAAEYAQSGGIPFRLTGGGPDSDPEAADPRPTAATRSRRDPLGEGPRRDPLGEGPRGDHHLSRKRAAPAGQSGERTCEPASGDAPLRARPAASAAGGPAAPPERVTASGPASSSTSADSVPSGQAAGPPAITVPGADVRPQSRPATPERRAGSRGPRSAAGLRVSRLVAVAMLGGLLAFGLFRFRDRAVILLSALGDRGWIGGDPSGALAEGEAGGRDAASVVEQLKAGAFEPRLTVDASARGLPPPTLVENITWEISGQETVVTIWANGGISPASCQHLRLTGERPREVLDLRGILSPFPTSRLTVNSPQVRQIRLGHHLGDPTSELRIVLDLAQAEARLEALHLEGTRLHLHVGSSPDGGGSW